MGLITFLIGTASEEKEQESKLREEVVKHYQPSMRVVGKTMLTMSAEEGRATAKIYGEDTAFGVGGTFYLPK